MKRLLNKYLVVLISVFLVVLLIIPSLLMADGYTFPSTNELNKTKQVPGRIGQDAPYVNQDSVDVGEVTLEFINDSNSLAFFEYRIDGESLSGGTSHPVVIGDYIYPGICVDGRIIPVCSPGPVVQTFNANEYVEIRLALGGERDWDFDWTRFDVLPKNNGPADKVTGSYWVDIGANSYYAEISAHGAFGKKDAKGNFYWSGVRSGQPYYFEATVTDVDASGNKARVWGTVDNVVGTTHIKAGWTFWFDVVDGGSPGTNGDTMEYQWLTGNSSHWGPVAVTDGNLVVHTYE